MDRSAVKECWGVIIKAMAEAEIGVWVAIAALEYWYFRRTALEPESRKFRAPRCSTGVLPSMEEFTLARPHASLETHDPPKQIIRSRPARNTFPAGFSPMRRGSISSEPMSEEDLCWSAPINPKTEEEKGLLLRILRKNILMQHLAIESLDAVVQALQRVQIAPGQVVITEGEFGDGSFIVEDGTLSCSMKKRGIVCEYGPVSPYSE